MIIFFVTLYSLYPLGCLIFLFLPFSTESAKFGCCHCDGTESFLMGKLEEIQFSFDHEVDLVEREKVCKVSKHVSDISKRNEFKVVLKTFTLSHVLTSNFPRNYLRFCFSLGLSCGTDSNICKFCIFFSFSCDHLLETENPQLIEQNLRLLTSVKD